jgi:hypothetical protein
MKFGPGNATKARLPEGKYLLDGRETLQTPSEEQAGGSTSKRACGPTSISSHIRFHCRADHAGAVAIVTPHQSHGVPRSEQK